MRSTAACNGKSTAARRLRAGRAAISGIFTKKPGDKPKLAYGTEVFHLNEALTEKAYQLSKDAELVDSDVAKADRAHYPSAPANAPPAVSICDTVSDDTWWACKQMSAEMAAWAKTLTDGAATYCTTQQEDNATLTALQRADMGRLDMSRVAILRAAADFDQEYPGETAAQLLAADFRRLRALRRQRLSRGIEADGSDRRQLGRVEGRAAEGVSGSSRGGSRQSLVNIVSSVLAL